MLRTSLKVWMMRRKQMQPCEDQINPGSKIAIITLTRCWDLLLLLLIPGPRISAPGLWWIIIFNPWYWYVPGRVCQQPTIARWWTGLKPSSPRLIQHSIISKYHQQHFPRLLSQPAAQGLVTCFLFDPFFNSILFMITLQIGFTRKCSQGGFNQNQIHLFVISRPIISVGWKIKLENYFKGWIHDMWHVTVQ